MPNSIRKDKFFVTKRVVYGGELLSCAMNITRKIEYLFERLLPTPMSIALVLTALAFILGLVFTQPRAEGAHIAQLLSYWGDGLWDGSLMIFAMQMALILVLGHILALSKPVAALINKLVAQLDGTAQTASIVALFSMAVALFNWGLGLIFGAIFARKVAEAAALKNKKINYPLVGAAGYSGLMVWHGGLSGSAPLKANEVGHIKGLMASAWPPERVQELPDIVPLEATIFSASNILASVLLLILIPIFLYFFGKNVSAEVPKVEVFQWSSLKNSNALGAERLDIAPWFGRLFGLLLLIYTFLKTENSSGLGFLTPNYLNGLLLALGLLFHQNIASFLRALDDAISGAAGILIQFPLYFGIMALMRESGLVAVVAEFFSDISTAQSFPFFTFISAAIINVFVPSGGGQWAVQAPVLIEAGAQLGVPLHKSIMALAYGDQLTNMMQPFWALPLLAITGLKAKEILPYSLLVMLAGGVIYTAVIFIF